MTNSLLISAWLLLAPITNGYSIGDLRTNIQFLGGGVYVTSIINHVDFWHCCPSQAISFRFQSEVGKVYTIETLRSLNPVWLEFLNGKLVGNYSDFLPTNIPGRVYVKTNGYWWMLGDPIVGNGSNITVIRNSLDPKSFFRVRKL